MLGKSVAARLRSESGFTIVESVVALAIVFALVVALLRTMDTGTRVIVETKRQAAATAFASELLERARSLEWNHMGLTSVANGTTCPTEVGCTAFSDPTTGVFGTDLTLNPLSGNWDFGGEEIVFVNGATFDPFLSFHDQQERDNTPFDRYLFVTSVRTDPLDSATEKYRRITAIVSWVPPSGFPKDVRLSTLVSPFTEPSQPLIHGEVTLDGGSLSVNGNVAGSGAWVGAPRGLFQANLVFSDGFDSATSDYVSSEIARSSTTSGDVKYAGLDGLFDTADDVLIRPGPIDVLRAADDDAVSVAPLDDSNAILTSLPPAFQISGAYPNDFTVADLSDVLAAQTTKYWAELWTEYNPTSLNPKVDGLPYASFGLESADRTNAGFIEYANAAVRTLYEARLGDTLDAPFYEFAFFARGHDSVGPALTYSANVDRYDAPSPSTDRQVRIDYSWAAEPLYLFPDSIGPLAKNTFQGWVIIETPLVFGTDLAAGENAARPPDLSTTGNVIVKLWDPGTGKYNTVYSGFGAIGSCSALPSPDLITIDNGAGGPLTWDIAPSGDPQLHYEVQGSILVRKPCRSYAEDTNLDVSEARVQATALVTGTIRYRVVDTIVDADPLLDGMLYDVELTFDLGGVGVTALYFDPEAS
jgi:type II secretory pathway pseudopilin PulG